MLSKQKVSIPLSEGIETKVDSFQKQIGSLENLENASFDEPGRIKKRTGYEKIDTLLVDDSNISKIQKLAKYKDELCAFNKTRFHSYSESTNKWTNKGTVSNIFPTTTSIIRNTYKQSNIQSCFVSGINAYAWEDSRGGVRISIIDNSTGNALLSDTEITATGIRPKVEYIGNDIFFFYIDSSDLKYRKINPVRPDTIEAEVVAVSSDINATNKVYDTLTLDKKIFIGWNSSTATLKLRTLSETGSLSATQEEVLESPTSCLGLTMDSSSRVLISYHNGSEVKALIRTFNLTANIVPPTIIESIININNVTMSSTSSSDYVIMYEQSSTNTYDHMVKQNTINLAATVGTPTVFIRSCGLASHIFQHDSNNYVAAVHQSQLQSSIFILNSDAEIVSKVSPTLAGDLLDFGNLPTTCEVTSDTFIIASQIKGRTISEENTLYSILGASSTELDFNKSIRYDNAVLGEQLHTNGGLIQSYDGSEIVEHGFNIFPENLQDSGTSATGGFLSDGVYQYSAVYTWTDNKGQQHQSSPSVPISITLSAGGSVQTQTITVPTLRITEKSNVVIDLYRTENVGTIFYKVTSTTSPTYNDPTVNSINIVDTLSDSTILSNEVIYTTGGVLDNIAPPSASIIETFGNRIFLAGLENTNKVLYSKIRTDGKPVEFNDTLYIDVNPKGGDITALSTMDDKLIIFKDNAIFYLTGDGPNNLGEQDNFIDPELVSIDLGCVDQESLVLTPNGLMFKSKKGIYLLDRSMRTSYIGSAVEDFNNYNIKSATLVPEKNIVIFLTDKDALVFDYYVNKWVKYTNHSGISSISLKNDYYYIRNNSELYKSSDRFNDNGSFIKLKLETSWLSFAGIQGHQRVYRMVLLGEYKSDHKLIMKAAYNFLDAYVQEKTVDSSTFTSDSVYGVSTNYGSETPYGGEGNKYQIRFNMKKQKCESIKILIEDSQSSNYAESLQISNLLFIIGVKSNDFKLPQAQSVGTK